MSSDTSPRNRLRIIGGQWRGRKLEFPNVADLRPTPDRVRETVFNWLQPVIDGARCLDLFAGSGALGFEALSRGAAHVVMVERDSAAVAKLRANLMLLKTEQGRVIQRDAHEFLAHRHDDIAPFDIVFLDPPYHRGLLDPCFAALVNGSWLCKHAYIYFEAERTLQKFKLPPGFQHVRNKSAGQVGYHLAVAQSSILQQGN